MDKRTFKAVGWSTINGVQKIRFTNDKYRQRTLERHGQTNIFLIDTPVPMTKEQAVKFLLDRRDTPATIKQLGKLFLEQNQDVIETPEEVVVEKRTRGRPRSMKTEKPSGGANPRQTKNERKHRYYA